jgi:hypothetical protein
MTRLRIENIILTTLAIAVAVAVYLAYLKTIPHLFSIFY